MCFFSIPVVFLMGDVACYDFGWVACLIILIAGSYRFFVVFILDP